MDLILFWVYVTYYKVYKNVLGLMLSNIEYVKVSKYIYLNTLQILIENNNINKPSCYNWTEKCRYDLYGLLGKNPLVLDLISLCD